MKNIVLFNGILNKVEKRTLIENFGSFYQVRYDENFLDDFLGEKIVQESTKEKVNFIFVSETNPYLVSQIVIRQNENLKAYFLSYNNLVGITPTETSIRKKVRV